jgi:hypothetical protein
MIAIIADIIASVEPQQMVISRSGSTRTFCVAANFSTMASRSGFGRRGEVREALGKIHCVVFLRQPRHFANDRFGELLGFSGKHARIGVQSRLGDGRIRGSHADILQ